MDGDVGPLDGVHASPATCSAAEAEASPVADRAAAAADPVAADPAVVAPTTARSATAAYAEEADVNWFADRLDWMVAPWTTLSDIQAQICRLQLQVLDIKGMVMATAEEFAARLDNATNELASDLQAVRDDLAAALADVDAEKQAAVDEALAKLDGPISRLEALGADPADPVPSGDGGGTDTAPGGLPEVPAGGEAGAPDEPVDDASPEPDASR